MTRKRAPRSRSRVSSASSTRRPCHLTNAHSRSTWSDESISARTSAPRLGSLGALVSRAASESGVAGRASGEAAHARTRGRRESGELLGRGADRLGRSRDLLQHLIDQAQSLLRPPRALENLLEHLSLHGERGRGEHPRRQWHGSRNRVLCSQALDELLSKERFVQPFGEIPVAHTCELARVRQLPGPCERHFRLVKRPHSRAELLEALEYRAALQLTETTKRRRNQSRQRTTARSRRTSGTGAEVLGRRLGVALEAGPLVERSRDHVEQLAQRPEVARRSPRRAPPRRGGCAGCRPG